jgi:ABC-type branched-subunit amino acid transport system ATPase component
MLKISDLHVYYGGIHALKGISLDVPTGKIVTLIGANGAGKSSTLRAISGLIKNKKGPSSTTIAISRPSTRWRSSRAASSCLRKAAASSRTSR